VPTFAKTLNRMNKGYREDAMKDVER
jgi:hypothetical protein